MIPGRGTKILRAVRCSQKKKKKELEDFTEKYKFQASFGCGKFCRAGIAPVSCPWGGQILPLVGHSALHRLVPPHQPSSESLGLTLAHIVHSRDLPGPHEHVCFPLLLKRNQEALMLRITGAMGTGLSRKGGGEAVSPQPL